jgi:uncharacterized protein YbjT (DUF2867 family)
LLLILSPERARQKELRIALLYPSRPTGKRITVAAAVLNQGPEKHHERDYWLSTEVLGGSEVAAILSEVTGRNIGYNSQGPDDVKALVSSLGDQVEPWYAEGGVDFMRQ